MPLGTEFKEIVADRVRNSAEFRRLVFDSCQEFAGSIQIVVDAAQDEGTSQLRLFCENVFFP